MKRLVKYLKIITLCILLIFLITNIIVINTVKDKIISKENIQKENIDYILVLGAGIKNKRPSPMLKDRLDLSILLYQNKVSPKILVSGDHINDNYDEVNVMKNYLLENDIQEDSIISDHAGISTYDSIYRAKYIYRAKNILIVTQKYHLYRALYIANNLGINAYGIPANEKTYPNQFKREIREVLARTKDLIKVNLKIPATYLEKN